MGDIFANVECRGGGCGYRGSRRGIGGFVAVFFGVASCGFEEVVDHCLVSGGHGAELKAVESGKWTVDIS